MLAATIAAIWTLAVYTREVIRKHAAAETDLSLGQFVVSSDITYAGVLASLAMFMMFYFF